MGVFNFSSLHIHDFKYSLVTRQAATHNYNYKLNLHLETHLILLSMIAERYDITCRYCYEGTQHNLRIWHLNVPHR